MNGALLTLGAVNYTSDICDITGAIHVCIILGDNIFEYDKKIVIQDIKM